MGPFIQAMFAILMKDKDLEFKFGQMVPVTKENGEATKLTARENFGMLMAISTMVIGKMTRLMGMASTVTRMELNTKVSGKTISRMVKV